MNAMLAIAGLTVLCGVWAWFQLWLFGEDSELKRGSCAGKHTDCQACKHNCHDDIDNQTTN
ncbi:hypothetical protein TI04_00295 [Achromatium sp. WMS2]|nr:hypothetical protein TI04_00295 [Achromatium sp. WMS2]